MSVPQPQSSGFSTRRGLALSLRGILSSLVLPFRHPGYTKGEAVLLNKEQQKQDGQKGNKQKDIQE